MPEVMVGRGGRGLSSPEVFLLSRGGVPTNAHLCAAQIVVWPQERRERTRTRSQSLF